MRMLLVRLFLIFAAVSLLLLTVNSFLFPTGSRHCYSTSLKMRKKNPPSNQKKTKSSISHRRGHLSHRTGDGLNRLGKNEAGLKNSFSKKELRSNFGAFLSVLLERSEMSHPISAQESKALNELISHHVAVISSSKIGKLVNHLGRLKSATENWRTKDARILILSAMDRFIGGMGSRDMANFITGMARIQSSWMAVVKSSADFEEILASTISKCGEKELGDIVWGMGSMSARWEYLSPGVKKSIFDSIQSNISTLSPFSISSLIWALAKMGMKWKDDGAASNALILMKRVKQQSPRFSAQQASKVAWALGTMGIHYKDLPTGLVDDILKNVGSLKKSQMGNGLTASHALTGVAKIGTQWNFLKPATKGLIWEQFTRVCQANDYRGVPNSIWAMAAMGATIDEQSYETTELIINSAERVLIDCNSWGLSNILWGLAKMKHKWDDLPRNMRESVMINVVRVEKELNSQDCSTILWSLGELDMSLDMAPAYFLDAILRTCERTLPQMKASDLARTMWGLSGTGVTWNMMPFRMRWNLNAALRRESDNMSPQAVANSAYSLSLIAFDAEDVFDAAFRGAHETLLSIIMKAGRMLGANQYSQFAEDDSGNSTALTASSENITKTIDDEARSVIPLVKEEIEQLRIFAHYVKVMQFVSDTKRVPADMLLKPSYSKSHPHPTVVSSSKLQERVVQGLEDALDAHEEERSFNKKGFSAILSRIGIESSDDAFRMESEVSSFHGIFPVDAAVLRGERILALLEVDGPYHYRRDGRLRRKDMLKETMYRRQHPNSVFHRIRWDEERRIGSDVLAKELVELVLKSSEKQDNMIVERARSVQKSMADFFSWSMRNEDENLH